MKPVTAAFDPALASADIVALVECLEQEYEALLAEDHEKLEAVLSRKETVLARLAALPAAALGQPQSDRGRAQAPWKQALERARALNQRNAQALAPRGQRNAARLRFLQSMLGREMMYAANGSLSGAPAPLQAPVTAG